MGASHLPTLRLTTATHSSWCLEAFHCSSTVSGKFIRRAVELEICIQIHIET